MSQRAEQRVCGLGCHELCIVSWVGGLKDTGIIRPPPNRKVICLTGGFFRQRSEIRDPAEVRWLLLSFNLHTSGVVQSIQGVCSAPSIHLSDATLKPLLMTTVNLESQKYERVESVHINQLQMLIDLIVINFDITLQLKIAKHWFHFRFILWLEIKRALITPEWLSVCVAN